MINHTPYQQYSCHINCLLHRNKKCVQEMSPSWHFVLLLNTTINHDTCSLGYKYKAYTPAILALAWMLTIGAHILGIHPQTISPWEGLRQGPSPSQMDAPSIRGVGNQKWPVGAYHSRRSSGQPAGGDAVLATRLKLIPWPAIAVRLVRYWPCAV